MRLEQVIQVGYAIMVVSILLMVWASFASSGAVCQFDPHCTCTSSHPNWGQVQCHDAPVYLPSLNTSKLFTLSLINNDLDYLPPRLLQGTGLYKLIIAKNPFYALHEESLLGLERSLWELHIVNCKLPNIPGNALRHLYKLKTLNLAGNDISSINTEQLRGVATSLQNLILSNNRLTVMPSGIFSSLQSLEVLDLHGNSISSLDPAVFTPAPPKLKELNLADNLFDNIPYKQLSNIRSLNILNLGYNHINKVDQGITGVKLTLDVLLLEYNEITHLGTYAMNNFDVANKTSFKANPIKQIDEKAFEGCRIVDLNLSECQLQFINPDSFDGLENTLQHLDITHNKLANITALSLNRYPALKSIHVDDSHFEDPDWLMLPIVGAFEGIPLSLLHINGKSGQKINLQRLPRLGHLRTFSVSNAQIGNISPGDLKSFTIELETLIAQEAGITSLPPHLFNETRGIKNLDLTDNRIDKIDSQCFLELGHSLEHLKLMHSFTSGVSALPPGTLKPLSSLKTLKLNHNSLLRLPEDISQLSHLETLYVHDNKIDSIGRNLFRGSVHNKLLDVNFSFNKISKILTNTFFDLEEILDIAFADNVINKIEQGAFADLIKLNSISLRGNRISDLPTETFQNLPCLSYLDLAHNSLTTFNFASLDQVGTLSSLTVNVSYNSIKILTPNVNFIGKENVYSSIKILDFSYNNITVIERNYLLPVQHSLTHLYLSHNGLQNASRDILPEMPQLQLLDLSHNVLTDIEFDALRSARNLQEVVLSYNRLKDIPDDLLLGLGSLRRVDLSYNLLYSVTDAIMSPPSLVWVDLSHNDLTRVPLSAFSPTAAAGLLHLDISNNRISGLPTSDNFARFENLRILDLSSNRFNEIGNVLSSLPRLSKLNMAHNFIHIGGKDFLGLQDTLEHLDISNVSVSYVPSLPLPSLYTLKMTHNLITFLPPDLSTNLSNLKFLDISFNNLQTIPQFPQLKTLYMAGNDINIISNSSFNEFPYVSDLDIRHLPLSDFDVEAMTSLLGLQSLHISPYPGVKGFNIPQWTKDNKGLRYLHIELKGTANFGEEMYGELPKKVRHIALTGREIKSLPDSLLKGIQHPSVMLTLRNTSVESIPVSVFSSLTHVRNISLDLQNNTIKSLANPSNTGAPNRPGKTFLVDLYMLGNQWTCDCQLGWVETWQRKRRQIYSVDYTIEDSRRSKCKNKKNKGVLEVLKTEMECGWSRSCSIQTTYLFIVFCLFVIKIVTNHILS